jgi:hypothetical protein
MGKPLARLSDQIQQSGVTATIDRPVSCMSSESALFDYLVIQFGHFVGFAGTVSFHGSMTPNNNEYGLPDSSWSLVTGFRVSDPSRALVTSVVAPSGTYVIPVLFAYFYPTCTEYNGAGNVFADVFGM